MSLEDIWFKKFLLKNFIMKNCLLYKWLYPYLQYFIFIRIFSRILHNKHLILENKIPKLKLIIISPFL